MRSAIQSAVKHLRREGLWVLLGRAYLSGGALLSSVILARLMTQDEMGTYRLVLSGLNLVAALALPGVFEVLIRHLPRGELRIYPNLFRRKIKFGILSMIGFALFCVLTFEHITLEQRLSIGAISLMLPLYLASQMYEAAYQAQMKFRQLSTIYIGSTTIQLITFVGAFLVFGSVFSAISVMIGFMTAYRFWNHLRIQQDLADSQETTDAPIGNVNREAMLISIFTILPAVTENIDKILLERISGVDTLAVYSIGVALGVAVNSFFKPFLTSINAKLVHRSPNLQHYGLVVIGGTLMGAVFSIVSPYLIPFMYGASYVESVPITIVITASMGLFFWRTLYSNDAMFNKKKRLRVVYISNMLVASITITYMLAVTALFENTDSLLLAFAFAYPIKMIMSILSLWIIGKHYR